MPGPSIPGYRLMQASDLAPVVQDGMTALAGGGQAGATPITKDISRFTTVGTAADSAVLPASAGSFIGSTLRVANASAASMNVFPATGDKINALSANAAFAVAAGTMVAFVCTGPGNWYTH